MTDFISISNDVRHDAELWTGRVLRIGVWISASLMIGGLLFAALWPSSIIMVHSNPSLSDLFGHIVFGAFDPVTLMFAGLVFLMCTPILRVITVMVGFAIERDWRFVIVSTIVFLMLLGEILYSTSI